MTFYFTYTQEILEYRELVLEKAKEMNPLPSLVMSEIANRQGLFH
jgi:hypothetical protein